MTTERMKLLEIHSLMVKMRYLKSNKLYQCFMSILIWMCLRRNLKELGCLCVTILELPKMRDDHFYLCVPHSEQQR